MSKLPYNRETLERALIHHGADYSPPDPARNGKWLLRTGIGNMVASNRDVYLYVVGMADKERAAKVEA